MLTTSSASTDVNLIYANHANSFISKPSDVDDFLKQFVR